MNLAFIGMAAALGLSASGSAFGAGFAGQAGLEWTGIAYEPFKVNDKIIK